MQFDTRLPFLACTQLGFEPGARKVATLCQADSSGLGDEVIAVVHAYAGRFPRKQDVPAPWKGAPYRWPFELLAGEIATEDVGVHRFPLRKTATRWGTFWQGDFTAFDHPGIYHLETSVAMSLPFEIRRGLFRRFERTYLRYLNAQRCGTSIAGLRDARHADDAILDTTGEHVDVSGGWYNAGDARKWLSLTLYNLDACVALIEHGDHAHHAAALDEIDWGNRYFHRMITPEGRVWEDVGGGDIKPGYTYDQHWWIENHPGCITGKASRRLIRTTYNPYIQWGFVRSQSAVARVSTGERREKCLLLADRAADYARRHPHDGRTLFRAIELRAAVERGTCGDGLAPPLGGLVRGLLERQDRHANHSSLTGFFIEADGEPFRSVAYACEPAMALLRALESGRLDTRLQSEVADAIRSHLDRFLLVDAGSNPFGVTPYGAYRSLEHASHQTFRSVGGGLFVRSFIHPFNAQRMVHGTNSVTMHQAALLLRAGVYFRESRYVRAGESLLQWATGHNTTGLSLFLGVGFRHPVPFSAETLNVSDAAVTGFAGTPEDTPYLETSTAVEWSTQEVWDVPHYYALEAAQALVQARSSRL